jgi:hypothetical protein
MRTTLMVGSKSYTEKLLRTFGSSLIGYWPQDELSGTVAYDRSGNGRNGAYTGVSFVGRANQVANGGFETAGAGGADVFGSWTETASDGAIAAETTLVHGGAKAAKLTAGAGKNARMYQYATVVPGKSYQVSLWMAGDGTNQARFYVMDVTHSWDWLNEATGPAAAAYAQSTIDFTAPAGCYVVALQAQCPNAVGGIGYFDDIALMGVDLTANGIGNGSDAPYYDGVNDSCNIYSAGLVGAFSGPAGTMLAWAQTGAWTDSTQRCVFALASDTSNIYQMFKSATANRVGAQLSAGGVGETNSYPASLGTAWFQFALTWTGGVGRVYLNGAALGGAITIGTWSGALATVRCCIGARKTDPTDLWSGLVGPVAIGNAALNPGQIAELARVT